MKDLTSILKTKNINESWNGKVVFYPAYDENDKPGVMFGDAFFLSDGENTAKALEIFLNYLGISIVENIQQFIKHNPDIVNEMTKATVPLCYFIPAGENKAYVKMNGDAAVREIE